MSQSNLQYCQIYTITLSGVIEVGGQAKMVNGNFDTFAAVGDVRLDKNCLPEESENLFFKELFVFDFGWARKWDRILYGKTDGYKTGIYFPVSDPFSAALVLDEELQSCELVEVSKEIIREANGLTRHYSFDGNSLSVITTN